MTHSLYVKGICYAVNLQFYVVKSYVMQKKGRRHVVAYSKIDKDSKAVDFKELTIWQTLALCDDEGHYVNSITWIVKVLCINQYPYRVKKMAIQIEIIMYINMLEISKGVIWICICLCRKFKYYVVRNQILRRTKSLCDVSYGYIENNTLMQLEKALCDEQNHGYAL